MSDLNLIKLISVLLIFLSTLLAGIYPFLKRIYQTEKLHFPYCDAFASGIFLGVGIIHLLPEAAQKFYQLHEHYPWAYLIASIVFLILLWLEHLARRNYQQNLDKGFAIIALVMLSIHSFFAGAALGLTTHLAVVTMIALALLAHKWAAALALAVTLNKSRLRLSTSAILFLIFALMVPLGALFGDFSLHYLHKDKVLEPIFMSLAAGTFIYLGTLHGLSNAVMVKMCCNLKQFNCVLLGFALMAIVAIWI